MSFLILMKSTHCCEEASLALIDRGRHSSPKRLIVHVTEPAGGRGAICPMLSNFLKKLLSPLKRVFCMRLLKFDNYLIKTFSYTYLLEELHKNLYNHKCCILNFSTKEKGTVLSFGALASILFYMLRIKLPLIALHFNVYVMCYLLGR